MYLSAVQCDLDLNKLRECLDLHINAPQLVSVYIWTSSISVDLLVLFGKCIYIHGQNFWNILYMLSVTYSNDHLHKKNSYAVGEAALCLSVSHAVTMVFFSFLFFTHLK